MSRMRTRREFLRTAGAVAAVGALVDVADLAVAMPAGAAPSGALKGDGPGPATTKFMDGLWNEEVGLIENASTGLPPPVRETSWYALGLLTRDGAGDAARAQRAIETVVSKQYDSPGTLFHGSFPRFASDPALPPADAQEFVGFDPNWRQFIGTALALGIERFGDKLGGVRSAAERSVDLAAAGERVDRVEPDYSNIAIMHAWLLAHTGSRQQGEKLAREIAARYRRAHAIDEYNSPTYDGVALYGLALWREEPPSRLFASLGNELSDGLWKNVAGTYHAGLRNSAGPYSRAVGMDLSDYASLVGLWIWSAVGQDLAPFPELVQPIGHAGDVCFGPLVDLFSPDVPRAALRSLRAFRGERTVRAGLEGTWEATSWLASDVMLGGHTGAPVRVGGQQIHPATAHWANGWIRILGDSRIDAVASKGRLALTIADPGPATVTIGVPGLDPALVTPSDWQLPGLRVAVSGDSVPVGAPTGVDDGVELAHGPGSLTLEVVAG